MSNKLYKNLERFSKTYETSVDLALSWMTEKVKTSLLPGVNSDFIKSEMNPITKEASIYYEMDVVDEITEPYTQITETDALERGLDVNDGKAVVEIDSQRITKMVNTIGKENVAREIKNMEFFFAVEALAKDKGISVEFIFDRFKESVIKAAKRQDAELRKQAEAKRRAELRKLAIDMALEATEDSDKDYEEALAEAEEQLALKEENAVAESENVFCDINTASKTIRIYRKMQIVEEVINPTAEMTVLQAENYGGGVIGGFVEIELEPRNLGRLFAMNVKGIIRQAISEEEKKNSKRDVQDKDREVVNAVVQYINDETGDAKIQIGKAYFTLTKGEQIPGEVLKEGQTIKVYVSVTKNEDEYDYINISRKEAGLVRRLFELEVPEIADGIVEIISTSREAGSRTKIAVNSTDANVDPVGACIGPKGQRVSVVIDALCGEKIDIVRFSEQPEEYIAAALAPAKVTSVTVDEETQGAKRTCHVVVPNDQLSLAIGNKGQNVRLAAKLTGWKIDIRPEQE